MTDDVRPLSIVYTAGSLQCGLGTTLAVLHDDARAQCHEEPPCQLHGVLGPHLDLRRDFSHRVMRKMWSRGERRYSLDIRAVMRRYLSPDNLREAARFDDDMRREVDFLGRADAIVFLANCTRRGMNNNQRRLRRLTNDYRELARPQQSVPVVFQLNFRDYGPGQPDPEFRGVPIAELKSTLTWPRCDYLDAFPPDGTGVCEALDRAIDLYEELQAERARPLI